MIIQDVYIVTIINAKITGKHVYRTSGTKISLYGDFVIKGLVARQIKFSHLDSPCTVGIHAVAANVEHIDHIVPDLKFRDIAIWRCGGITVVIDLVGECSV